MLKRLGIFFGIVAIGTVYVFLNRWIVGVARPAATVSDLWAWTVVFVLMGTPVSLLGLLVFIIYPVHCLVSWIVLGEIIELLEWRDKINKRKAFQVLHNKESQIEEDSIMKELNEEYPGMEG